MCFTIAFPTPGTFAYFSMRHCQFREIPLIMCLMNASSHLLLSLSQEEVPEISISTLCSLSVIFLTCHCFNLVVFHSYIRRTFL